MKQNDYLGTLLSLLFIFLIYCFTRNYYIPFFWMVFCLLVLIVFLKETNRLFAWVMISFFGGHLIVIYIDKFIEGLIDVPFYRVMINQLLFIIPILSMCYVMKQFNERISFYFKKPVPLRVSKFLSIILLLIFVSAILLFFNKNIINVFLSIVTFSLIFAVIQEVMWRGILLTQMMKMTSKKTAILFSSIAFSINTTIFGFTSAVFLLNLAFGLMFGFLTAKYKSILPAIVVHTLVLLFSFLNGWIQLPI